MRGKKLLAQSIFMKKEFMGTRKTLHPTRPPRLEGKVKNAMMYSPKKKKKASAVAPTPSRKEREV